MNYMWNEGFKQMVFISIFLRIQASTRNRTRMNRKQETGYTWHNFVSWLVPPPRPTPTKGKEDMVMVSCVCVSVRPSHFCPGHKTKIIQGILLNFIIKDVERKCCI